MKTLALINGQTATFFEDADEGTIDRYRLLQQTDLERRGIGWTKVDHSDRLQTVRSWLLRGDLQAATTALDNALVGFQAMLSVVDLLSASVACLLVSIDGQPVTATTEAGLLAAFEPIVPYISVIDAEDLIENVKKKYSIS